MEPIKLSSSCSYPKQPGRPAYSSSSFKFNYPEIYDFSSNLSLKGRVCSIKDEILSEEQGEIKEKIAHYLIHRDKKRLDRYEEKAINFFEGTLNFAEISCCSDLRKLLEIIKIIDFELAEYNKKIRNKYKFPVSSYDIRTKILDLDPNFTTNEIYTKTLDPRKFKNREYLQYSINWIPERVGFHAKIVINQYVKTLSLSKSLKRISNNNYVVRGPTAAGKSDFIRKLLKPLLDDNENISGILNPDEFKFSVKHLLPCLHYLKGNLQLLEYSEVLSKIKIKHFFSHLVNVQVHPEGAALFQKFKKGIQDKPLALIFEGRFTSNKEISDVLSCSRKKNRKVFLVDIAHASLSLSLRRILTRDPYGNDPCPFVHDVVKGYVESIKTRERLLSLVKNNPSIEFFNLYFLDELENMHLIACKEENKLNILSDKLVKKSCSSLLDWEIENLLDEVIDKDIYPKLEKWDGEKIKTALNNNASINAVKSIFVDASKWGEVKLEPFNGLWLYDYPFLKEHIDSEHILDIRKSDLDGEGYHWTEDKFPEGPNLKFSQDVRVEYAPRRGLQMKLGYFLIHPKLFEKHLARPDPRVSEQLIDKETNYFRFFVHPEAYDNFVKLHFCREAIFVKPEDSEFMGTPTSSYRSWCVRDISSSERTIPFIVKMGVGSARNRGKFLPREDVLKSIKIQNDLYEMKKRDDFFYFSETIGITFKENLFEEDSGLIVREIPTGLLRGEFHIFSFSALMSIERTKEENYGVCRILPQDSGLEGYPLIYEIIEKAKQKKLVKSSFEFINTYLVKKYFEATKKFFFKKGYSFSPHGQNLCFVVSYAGTPLGFAYRDLEGVSEKGDNYLASYGWFYRYHCMVKLLNVMTKSDQDYFDPPLGAPVQLGFSEPLKERNLYPFLKGSLKKLHAISLADYKNILHNLDNLFLVNLSKYYYIKNIHELKVGAIPSAEPGSDGEAYVATLDKRLLQNRHLHSDLELSDVSKKAIRDFSDEIIQDELQLDFRSTLEEKNISLALERSIYDEKKREFSTFDRLEEVQDTHIDILFKKRNLNMAFVPSNEKPANFTLLSNNSETNNLYSFKSLLKEEKEISFLADESFVERKIELAQYNSRFSEDPLSRLSTLFAEMEKSSLLTKVLDKKEFPL
ncbi:MAG: hypothetical protein H0T62_11540 [Parachlamydiaceae bacterium]|nr:hypothetical protein [Parachlamydiaceae bacterium]